MRKPNRLLHLHRKLGLCWKRVFLRHQGLPSKYSASNQTLNRSMSNHSNQMNHSSIYVRPMHRLQILSHASDRKRRSNSHEYPDWPEHQMLEGVAMHLSLGLSLDQVKYPPQLRPQMVQMELHRELVVVGPRQLSHLNQAR